MRRILVRLGVGALAAAVLVAPARAAVTLTSIGAFQQPIYVTAPPGDAQRVFVVERAGTVRIVKNGATLATPFLDVSRFVTTEGEGGLLSIAFPLDYAVSGRFYVDYTSRPGGRLVSRIVEYRRSANPERADPASARPLLQVDQPETNHKGGQLQFGPDGLLYIGFGDGGGGGDLHGRFGNAQNISSGNDLGKILRVDPLPSGAAALTVPRTNPLVGRAGANPRIYAWGLRNPWRFSFDRSTGAIAIGDVGQDAWEEVDWAAQGGARGLDYGWRKYEGLSVYNASDPFPANPAATPPVFVYGHDGSGAAITGGYVVRDRAVAELYGRYVYADSQTGRLSSLVLGASGASDDRPLAVTPTPVGVVSFGEDARGHVYLASLADNHVYRLGTTTPTPAPPAPTVSLTRAPVDPAATTTAAFAWTATRATAATCYVDGVPRSCPVSGGLTLTGLALGAHVFVVRVSGTGGVASTGRGWRATTVAPFRIAVRAVTRIRKLALLAHGLSARCATTRTVLCRVSLVIGGRTARALGISTRAARLRIGGGSRRATAATPALVRIVLGARLRRALARHRPPQGGYVLLLVATATTGGQSRTATHSLHVLRAS